jgi:hypothetical protein
MCEMTGVDNIATTTRMLAQTLRSVAAFDHEPDSGKYAEADCAVVAA